MRYTEKNLSKHTVRAVYIGSLFPSFQLQISKIQGIFIKTVNIKFCY